MPTSLGVFCGLGWGSVVAGNMVLFILSARGTLRRLEEGHNTKQLKHNSTGRSLKDKEHTKFTFNSNGATGIHKQKIQISAVSRFLSYLVLI